MLIRRLITTSCTQRNTITSTIIISPMTLTSSASPLLQRCNNTIDSTSEPVDYSRIDADNSRMMPKKASTQPTANAGHASATKIRDMVCRKFAP